MGHNEKVLTLNPAFVEIQSPERPTLLDRARDGDSDAFGEICRVYENRLVRQAMTLCGNATLAEDLAQDTFVEAWRGLRRFHGRCHFFTWLCAILLNRYRNAIREKRPLPLSSLARTDETELHHRLDNLADQNSPPDEAAHLREHAAQVLACLRELPAKQQQVIYLRFYVDDSLEGIAAVLGCSIGTVKSRLFRALDKLRKMAGLGRPSRTVELKVEN